MLMEAQPIITFHMKSLSEKVYQQRRRHINSAHPILAAVRDSGAASVFWGLPSRLALGPCGASRRCEDVQIRHGPGCQKFPVGAPARVFNPLTMAGDLKPLSHWWGWSGCYPVEVTTWAPPRVLRSEELPQAPPYLTGAQWAAARNTRRQKSASVNGVGTAQGPTVKNKGEEEKRLRWEDKPYTQTEKKRALALLDGRYQSLFQRVSPQRCPIQPWPVLVTFCPLSFSSLT